MFFPKVNVAEYAKSHQFGKLNSFRLKDSTTVHLLSSPNRFDRLRVTDAGDLIEFASSRGPKQSIAKQLINQINELMIGKK